jgi:hypothetical protein
MPWLKVLMLVRRAGPGIARSGYRSLGGKPDGEKGSGQFLNSPPHPELIRGLIEFLVSAKAVGNS